MSDTLGDRIRARRDAAIAAAQQVAELHDKLDQLLASHAELHTKLDKLEKAARRR